MGFLHFYLVEEGFVNQKVKFSYVAIAVTVNVFVGWIRALVSAEPAEARDSYVP